MCLLLVFHHVETNRAVQRMGTPEEKYVIVGGEFENPKARRSKARRDEVIHSHLSAGGHASANRELWVESLRKKKSGEVETPKAWSPRSGSQ
jgi:hypothetical protein